MTTKRDNCEDECHPTLRAAQEMSNIKHVRRREREENWLLRWSNCERASAVTGSTMALTSCPPHWCALLPRVTVSLADAFPLTVCFSVRWCLHWCTSYYIIKINDIDWEVLSVCHCCDIVFVFPVAFCRKMIFLDVCNSLIWSEYLKYKTMCEKAGCVRRGLASPVTWSVVPLSIPLPKITRTLTQLILHRVQTHSHARLRYRRRARKSEVTPP